MEIRRRLMMLGDDKMKAVTVTIQNACTSGNDLTNEIRTVIPSGDFVAWNTLSPDTLKLTDNSVAGICYLTFGTGSVRPINQVQMWSANYWHTASNMGTTTINVPAGSVFKAYAIEYN